jgi:hypothetical protein
MRTTLFALFLLALSLGASSQDYQLFNAGSKKVFTTFPDAGLAYSLAFDAAVQSGVDSVYYPYRDIEDEYMSPLRKLFF